jgi:hypothetical protein
MLLFPARRRAPMARLRQVAMARSRFAAGRRPRRTSLSDVVQGFDLPVAADQPGELGGCGLFRSEAGDRVEGLDADLAGLAVRRRLSWTAWRALGKSRLFTVHNLMRRISPRPCPVSRVRPCSGICFQGRDLSCLWSFFVESAAWRGALGGVVSARLLPEPDVRVSPHPALQWCYCVSGRRDRR